MLEVVVMNVILISFDRCNISRFFVNRNKEYVNVKVKLIEGNIYMYRR